jgi:hypothetical protein
MTSAPGTSVASKALNNACVEPLLQCRAHRLLQFRRSVDIGAAGLSPQRRRDRMIRRRKSPGYPRTVR